MIGGKALGNRLVEAGSPQKPEAAEAFESRVGGFGFKPAFFFVCLLLLLSGCGLGLGL